MFTFFLTPSTVGCRRGSGEGVGAMRAMGRKGCNLATALTALPILQYTVFSAILQTNTVKDKHAVQKITNIKVRRGDTTNNNNNKITSN